MPPRREVTDALIGRDGELKLLQSFLDEAALRGGALLVAGEPGVGKSVLLDMAAEVAASADTRVLRAAGVEFEAELSYSGLSQLFLPVGVELEQLSGSHRGALSVALGLGEGPGTGRVVVSNAALALVHQIARAGPLLLIVDDLQWLDRSSAAVLAFVARRLGGGRAGFIAALRSGAGGFFERAGLPLHELQPLDGDAASRLLSSRFPALAATVCRRVLSEAQGNPLAILELPVALSLPQRNALQAMPALLPLSRRLHRMFASRISDLPASSRKLLILAALDGTGDLRVLEAAASGSGGLEGFAPAERARLVRVDERTQRVAFHHPIVRSTVVEISTWTGRRRAHSALAEALADQPDRRAWHLSAATVGPDEGVARLLTETARRALQRGDATGAVAALLRSADLSRLGSDRGRRLAEAAYVGADVTGELRNVRSLLADARRADPTLAGSLQAATAAAYRLLNEDGDVDTSHTLLVGAIETTPHGYDFNDQTLLNALHTLVLICFFGGRASLWEPFHVAVGRLTPRIPTDLLLCSYTFADPVEAGSAALDQLEAAIAGLRDEVDPTYIVRIGIAATYVDRLAGCREALWRVVKDGREGGAVASSINALILVAVDDYATGRWDEAEQLLDEALRLCETHGYRLLGWPGQFVSALLAASRGDNDTMQALTDNMAQSATPRGALTVQQYCCHARALAAIGRGDFEDAYQQASAVSPAGVLASHTPHALWVAFDLVMGAVHTNRQDEAAAHVAAMQEANIAALSPRLALLTRGSAALATPDNSAIALFEEAIAIPGSNRWPFDLARIHLAYGERLRRARALTQSRTQLGAALDVFRRLGAQPWVTRASNELRATGYAVPRIRSQMPDALTPQEREIATMAASGMSNKQIGARLFLSHRTVGAHLYRVFPKLGITSRAALRDALAPVPSEQRDVDHV